MAEVSVGARPRVEARVGHRVALTADVAVLAESVVSASVSDLVLILEQLRVAGEVEIEDEPEYEDVPGDDEETSELDYGDEDGPAEDQDYEEMADPECDPYRDDNLKIRVRHAAWGWRCEVPQSGWEGVRGKSHRGKKAVNDVSARMQIYQCIADWLERNHQDFLEHGPWGFEGPIFKKQVELIDSGCFRDVKAFGESKDGGVSLLSRSLNAVDLVWDDGALPLRRLFGD